MTIQVRPIEDRAFSQELADREQCWRVTVISAHGTTEPLIIPVGGLGITLPAGTQVRISSSLTRLRFSVFEREGTPLYETLHGCARPAVTVVVYRQTPQGIEVGVVYQKRYLCESPTLAPLCDEQGFLVCAEPPGGGIEDADESPARDLLLHAPTRSAIETTIEREVAEEFGKVRIVKTHVPPYPISCIGVGSTPLFVAFVEVATDDSALAGEPEPTEQIVGRGFVPLRFALDRCLDQWHDKVFWGRICNFWPLFDHWLRTQA